MADGQAQIYISNQKVIGYIECLRNAIPAGTTGIWNTRRCSILIQRNNIPGKSLCRRISVIVPHPYINRVRASCGWKNPLAALCETEVNVENPACIIASCNAGNKKVIHIRLIICSTGKVFKLPNGSPYTAIQGKFSFIRRQIVNGTLPKVAGFNIQAIGAGNGIPGHQGVSI